MTDSKELCRNEIIDSINISDERARHEQKEMLKRMDDDGSFS